ncbi:hypothetical protein ACH4F6_13175 [Streptomyces sp. NPDC017936]|uniref:hypothetical protein n=1 Tax=Streptomyces sp. NPDC017936 TaxID=3365016 RepID=UPI0037B0B54E
MRSTLRIAACTAVVLSAFSFGAASASAQVLAGPADTGTVNGVRADAATTDAGAAVGVAVQDLTSFLGSLPVLAGLCGEPEWS